MANERWKSDQERDRYREDDYGRGRGEWDRDRRQGVSGERDFASRDYRDPERGFYSGSAEANRGYQGYGGGGGDPRSGRFSDERQRYERGEWRERDRQQVNTRWCCADWTDPADSRENVPKAQGPST